MIPIDRLELAYAFGVIGTSVMIIWIYFQVFGKKKGSRKRK